LIYNDISCIACLFIYILTYLLTYFEHLIHQQHGTFVLIYIYD